MTFSEIFAAYYNLYRADNSIPLSTDDEYAVGLRLANEAVNRWAFYDGMYWRTLFNTLQNADDGTKTITTSTTDYDAPSDMQEVGGFIMVNDSNGNIVQKYDIIDPQEVQFRGDMQTYAYFTGDPGNGFVLHLNPAPPSSLNGLAIDYVYYKQPTLFASGGDVSECPDPYFIVNRMLAQQFRASRNPYYGSAKDDAENALKQMKMTNDSGNWADPWALADRSGTSWGR